MIAYRRILVMYTPYLIDGNYRFYFHKQSQSFFPVSRLGIFKEPNTVLNLNQGRKVYQLRK